jgi:hypothetical protein
MSGLLSKYGGVVAKRLWKMSMFFVVAGLIFLYIQTNAHDDFSTQSTDETHIFPKVNAINENKLQSEDVFHLANYPNNIISHRSIRIPKLNKNQSLEGGQNMTNFTRNSRRFSRFRCSGDEKSTQGFYERVCVFENVCYNSMTKFIEYYSRPDSPQVYFS